MHAPLLKTLGGLVLTLVGTAVHADEITVTDVAGREVTVDAPVDRVILGEGRQIYLLAALQPEDPFAHVVGWREDFSQLIRTTTPPMPSASLS